MGIFVGKKMSKNLTSYQIVQEIINLFGNMDLVGLNTDLMNDMAHAIIIENGALPYNLGYKPEWAPLPYPKTLCISVNDEIAHGITHGYKLAIGDLVSIDVGVEKDHLIADSGRTFAVGEVSEDNKELLYVAERCVKNALSVLKDGVTVLDIARIVEKTAFRYGKVTNHRLTGHSVDTKMHGDITIPSFVFMETMDEKKMYFQTLKTGDKICIEPFLTKSDSFGFIDVDGWTIKTRNGDNSAFFEAMVEITAGGFKYLVNPFIIN